MLIILLKLVLFLTYGFKGILFIVTEYVKYLYIGFIGIQSSLLLSHYLPKP